MQRMARCSIVGPTTTRCVRARVRVRVRVRVGLRLRVRPTTIRCAPSRPSVRRSSEHAWLRVRVRVRVRVS